MAQQLSVKLLTGEIHSVDSSACRTVWDFKIQIGYKTGVPPYQQKLVCQNSTHVDLQDTAALSQYRLQTGDTLLLMVKNEESISIFLRNPNSRTSTYQVLPSDTVSRLRARIREQERVEDNQFWLTYEGQMLDDHHKLSYYNIVPNGTISMNLRLRGGALKLGGWSPLEPSMVLQDCLLWSSAPYLICATAKQPPLL
ncbi:ubiquitin-like protein ISG15 [Liasis olivaceus]